MPDTRLRKRTEHGRSGSKHGREVWTAVLPLPNAGDGSRRRHRFTFTGSRRDAERELVTVLARINQGQFIAPDRATFGKCVLDFLDRSRGFLAGRTWERYEQLGRLHVIPTLGETPVQRLSVGNLHAAYAVWRDRGLSAQSVLHLHRFVHRVLADAEREGLVRRNVASSATAPRAPRKEMRFWNEFELGKILLAARRSPPFEELVSLALATGARRSELVALRWSDVDLERGTVRIARSLEETRRGGIVERSPKNGKARSVRLPASTIAMLSGMNDDRCDQRDRGYVFPARDGGVWSPDAVSFAFRRIVKRAGVPHAGFHALRHSFASLSVAQGVGLKTVSEILGHSSIGVTSSVYAHLSADLFDDAARRMDGVLERAAAAAGRGVEPGRD